MRNQGERKEKEDGHDFLTFCLTLILAFYLACLDILSDIPFDILSDSSFDILSDMNSAILSDIDSDILPDIPSDILSDAYIYNRGPGLPTGAWHWRGPVFTTGVWGWCI